MGEDYMPYSPDSPADIDKVKAKLLKTYKNVPEAAAKQAIHVFNSVFEDKGEGAAWAAVYSTMNKRGLPKKASAARVASRWLVSGWHDLQPNEKVRVYHGTHLFRINQLINGFDANKEVPRDFGGRTTRGLFVTPKFSVAQTFAGGDVILEIEVRAKNLHGTDWDAVIDRHKWKDHPSHQEYVRKKYPDSFRPFLSETLLQKSEPQALLRGLVKPSQIKRVWHKGKWYTRDEFLAAGFEVYQPYSPNEPIVDIGVDLSYPNYSTDEFFDILDQALGKGREKPRPGFSARELFRYMLKKSGPKRALDYLKEQMESAGFGPTAQRAYLKRFTDLVYADWKDVRDALLSLRDAPSNYGLTPQDIRSIAKTYDWEGQWNEVAWSRGADYETLADMVRAEPAQFLADISEYYGDDYYIGRRDSEFRV